MTQQKKDKKQSIKRIGLAMPLHLYEKAVAVAEYRGCSINALIREMLWEWAEERESKAETGPKEVS